MQGLLVAHEQCAGDRNTSGIPDLSDEQVRPQAIKEFAVIRVAEEEERCRVQTIHRRFVKAAEVAAW